MRAVSRCRPNSRETSRMLIPSTITALRTRRYTSTLYIHRTIRGVGYNPMNDGGRYSIWSPILSNLPPTRPTLSPRLQSGPFLQNAGLSGPSNCPGSAGKGAATSLLNGLPRSRPCRSAAPKTTPVAQIPTPTSRYKTLYRTCLSCQNELVPSRRNRLTARNPEIRTRQRFVLLLYQ